MIILALGGGGAKVSEPTRKRLFLWGSIFLFIGFFLTILVSIFQILSSYSFVVVVIWGLVLQVILYITSPTFILVFGLSGLSITGLRQLRIRQIEKGYKIQAIPVMDEREYNVGAPSRYAYIQVENIGRGEVTCAARLVKLTRKPLWRGTRQEVKVSEINPHGHYLGWGQRRNGYEILRERIPTTVCLIIKHYRDKARFIFAGSEVSQPIEPGHYTIRIELLRWKGRKWIDFLNFEETLEVNNNLEWKKRKTRSNFRGMNN